MKLWPWSWSWSWPSAQQPPTRVIHLRYADTLTTGRFYEAVRAQDVFEDDEADREFWVDLGGEGGE